MSANEKGKEQVQVLYSGIVSQNAATTQNIGVALKYEKVQQDVFLWENKAHFSALCGLIHSSQYQNQMAQISAIQSPNGDIGLKTCAGSPLTMEATAAGLKVAVGAADTQIKAATLTRRYLAMVNTSTGGQRITITFGAGAAVIDQGITLYPQGSYEMSEALGNLTLQEVRAIGSAAGAQLSVQGAT